MVQCIRSFAHSITEHADICYTLQACRNSDTYRSEGVFNAFKSLASLPFSTLASPVGDALLQFAAVVIKGAAWSRYYTIGFVCDIDELPENYTLLEIVKHVVKMVLHLATVGFFWLGWPGVGVVSDIGINMAVVNVAQRCLIRKSFVELVYPVQGRKNVKFNQDTKSSDSVGSSSSTPVTTSGSRGMFQSQAVRGGRFEAPPTTNS